MRLRTWGVLACVIVWGLVPLTWFQPGHFITTVDLYLPTPPADWFSQLFLWSPRFGTGAEQMAGPSAALSTGVTAAVIALGGSERLAQQVDFVLWFMLPGLAMGWFLRQLQPRRSWVFELVVINVYMFNLFLEALWGGNKAGLSAYAVLPLLLGITYRALTTQRWLEPAAAFALVSLVGSGASTNIQVTFVMLLAWGILLLSYVAARCRSWGDAAAIGRFCVAAVVLTIGCHAFWFWPQLVLARDPVTWQSLKSFARETASWLSGISASTSLYNVARMQGAWTWYQGWHEPYNTYSALFRDHWFWIGLSWVWVGLVGIGIAASRRWLDGCFVLMAAVGVAFGTGIHSPLGPIYQWMILHVPLFGLVRSPWYKFTLLTCLGYAYLIGLATERLTDRLRAAAPETAVSPRRFLLPAALVFSVIGLNMVYAYPVTAGRMYPTAAERAKLKPCHVQVPDYVVEAGRWFDAHTEFFRVFHTPKHTNGISVYRWGFVGIPPVLYHTSTRPLLYNTGPLAFQESGNHLVTAAHGALQEGRTHRFGTILRLLGARYLLQEDDLDHDYFEADGDDPSFMKKAFAEQQDLVPERSFGPWHVYAVTGVAPRHAELAQHVIWVEGDAGALAPLANAGWLTPQVALVFRDDQAAPQAQAMPPGLIQGACLINPKGGELHELPAGASRLLLVQETTVLEASIEPETVWPSTVLKVQWNPEGFYGPSGVPEESSWLWMAPDPTNRLKAHLVLENQTPQPIVTHCQIVVQSAGADRNLYFYLNDELIAHPPVPHGRWQTLLLKGVRLKPGQNTIRLYSPSAWNTRGQDQRSVSFAFDPGQFRLGRLVYSGSLAIPRDDTYRISLWRSGVGQTAQGAKRLRLGSHELSLPAQQMAMRAWGPTSLPLNRGITPIEIHQDDVSDHFAVVLETGAPWPTPSLAPVTLEPVSPALYRGVIRLAAPGLLVFNESFSPRWQLLDDATGRPLALAHWRVNGFANGYWIPSAGTHRVRLEYTGQRAAWSGWRTSAGTVGICLGILAVGWFRRRDN